MKSGEKFSTNLATLANATELSASVIERIAGEEISNCIDGKPVRLADLTDLVAAKLQSHIAKQAAI